MENKTMDKDRRTKNRNKLMTALIIFTVFAVIAAADTIYPSVDTVTIAGILNVTGATNFIGNILGDTVFAGDIVADEFNASTGVNTPFINVPDEISSDGDITLNPAGGDLAWGRAADFQLDSGAYNFDFYKKSLGTSKPVVTFDVTASNTSRILLYSFTAINNSESSDYFAIQNSFFLGSVILKTGLGTKDITLDPGGRNVNPGSDNADSLGQSGTRWTTLWSTALNTGDVCTTIGCWTESINRYNESDMCWTYEQLTETQRNILGLWMFNSYEEYANSTDEPYIEDVFNEMRAKIDNDGRPDFALGREITYCFNEIGYNQAAIELLLDNAQLSKDDVKVKQNEFKKPVKDVGELKEKKGDNMITTTSTSTTTSTTSTTLQQIKL